MNLKIFFKGILSIYVFLFAVNIFAGFKFGIKNFIKEGTKEIDKKIIEKGTSVSITNPSNGATVSATVNITADTNAYKGIAKVEFYIDGNLKSTDSSSPYSYLWDTTQYSEGSHTVKVIAYDTVNQTSSNQHTVMVGNWQIVDTDLVKVVTGGGQYLMWPRDKVSDGCNSGDPKQWKTVNTSGQPTWDNVNKCYNYIGGNANDYPAFKWAENLVYKEYDDWRLPTKDELKKLYDYGRLNISSIATAYLSSTEYSVSAAYRVSFHNGSVFSYDKNVSGSVRAVRDSQ
ncbi:MAG: Ig-like domain-containing protein [bacterium]